jgi:peptide/nickel transport system permease protein
MVTYIVRRILATIPVMAVVALFVFSLLYIAPGDPAAMIAGDQATPADVERIRAALGLDRPFLTRFGEWSWQLLHGDLGTSIFTNVAVTAMIAQRVEPTLSLMVITMVFAVSVAVPIGIVAAWKPITSSTAPSWPLRCSASRSRCSWPAMCSPMWPGFGSIGCRSRAIPHFRKAWGRGSST